MKLFTIGDSVSQGFMSGAAARTDLAYSTLIARSMNLSNYRYPNVWGVGGLPLNLEQVLRQLGQKYGINISGLDWLTVAQTLGKMIDGVEDYYERGKGAANQPDPSGTEFYHNVAAQGFDVADAWSVTPKVCREEIARGEAKEKGDNLFGFPSATFYRTALKVLNPSLKTQFDHYSQLEWLKHHATQEGVDNLLLWLGANNALGTVMGLSIHQTPGTGSRSLLSLSREQRETWNLWHPNDFEVEYTELLDRVDQVMQSNRNPNFNVFVGTVPLVTIAPLAKGVGPTTEIEVNTDFGSKETYLYYKYYTYFFREEDAVRKSNKACLTLSDALYIDNCIRQYNQTIKRLVAQKNQNYPQPRYHIVDLSKALQDIAFKRNAGQVTYQFPAYFNYKYPPVNTKYYHADERGRLKQGGLFGLDGVHPSVIGQGLIAHEFLKVMQKVGVVRQINLDWDAIFKSDQLYSSPIPLMHELYENDQLAEFLVGWIAGKPAAKAESFHLSAIAENKLP